MENTKETKTTSTATVDTKSSQTTKSTSPFNLELKMSVIDASIIYVKTENELGYTQNSDIEQGVLVSYVNVEEKDGEDFINEQSVYIDFKWDMITERGNTLINKLIDHDIVFIEPQENEGLFAKGFKVLEKTKEPSFVLNRSMKMKVMTVIDKSNTFNKKTTVKTELSTIFKGSKMKKISINFNDIPKNQLENLKNKNVLIENITIYSKKNSFNNIYSTSTLPKEI